MTVEQTNFAIDVSRALIWQYDSAEKFKTLVLNKQRWMDENVAQFWENWYRDVYDIRTANDFGLQVWVIILGISFVLPETNAPTKIFGFQGSGRKNFGNGNFKPFGANVLTTEQKRTILRMRYMCITSDGTIDHVLRTLRIADPLATVVDHLDMSITVLFSIAILPNMRDAFEKYAVIPRPAGVKMNIIYGYSLWRGFDAQGQNFDNGSFGA